VNRLEQFRTRRDEIRMRLLKYTRQAFRMLPEMDRPHILDIGCGSGIPTIELARLSLGEVVGIDIDQTALDKLAEKIEQAGLSKQVKAINRSLLDMQFDDGSFDIIWAEGSIYAIGFEKGLSEWRRLLKPGGFMVIHDEEGDVARKLKQVARCGYELIDYLILNIEVWHDEYFAPLEKLLAEFEGSPGNEPELLEELRQSKVELDMFRKEPERNSSVYFVMKKI
jgi:ubiquinone/menaquinone biosynthesis C-methylase UbiE